jgi:hypothetical protein
MHTRLRIWRPMMFATLLAICGADVANSLRVFAQEPPAVDEAAPVAATGEEEGLAEIEARLAERYARLETLVERLAELSRSTQPRRATLLRQLIAQSRERDVTGQFEGVVAALEQESFSSAIDGQVALESELNKLLELLLQEDRDRQIDSERKRVGRYLQEVNRLIRLQRGVKARTDGGDEAQELADDQKQVGDNTKKLGDEVEEAEQTAAEKASSESPESDAKSEDNQNGESKEGAESQPSDGEPKKGTEAADSKESQSQEEKPKPRGSEEKSSDSEKKESSESGESKPGESPGKQGQPSDGKPSDGKPSESQPSPGSPSEQPGEPGQQSPSGEQPPSAEQPPDNPMQRAAKKLRQAQQRMDEAQKKLEEAQREGAVADQSKAVEELEQAKAEFERILRQLREEELERMLVMLEARFRKMLDEQVAVYDETKKLDAASAKAPAHELEIASGRLSRKETLIVREADRALVLLREDGTSTAFPEAIEQARDDMQAIAERLRETRVDLITQGLEEDVISALEETLAALQQALKDLRDQKGNQQPGQGGGEPGEKPLVDQLAELRMIRSLQVRVNKRTQQYGAMIEGEQAKEAELIEALEGLSLRQQKIFQATRELNTKEN